jgi:primosomal protein N' (replication factor Y)
VETVDPGTILRNHPLTLPLTRLVRDALRLDRRVALIATRGAPTLGCDDCAWVLRCPECGMALAYRAAARTLDCRVCTRIEPLPSRCEKCGGHRFSPVGWGPDRLTASLRKRFPGVPLAAGPAAAADPAARLLVGTPALLRALEPQSVAGVGLVSLDDLLGIPDFRAGERVFQHLWAAAEATRADGTVLVQTRLPDHYALAAARARDRALFYAPEIEFRRELGYPPFRRLCLVSATGRDGATAQTAIGDCREALRGLPGVSAYPAARVGTGPARRPAWRFVVKGPDELPRLLAGPLAPFVARRRRGGAVVEVEMDPQSL